MDGKKPCKKCLLADINPGEELEKIKKLIEIMPDNERVSEEIYTKRLNVCRECDSLSEGTCLVCGCYAELRAAKRKVSCPAHRW